MASMGGGGMPFGAFASAATVGSQQQAFQQQQQGVNAQLEAEGGLSGALAANLNRQLMMQNQDPMVFTEACVVRAVGSGLVGGLMGAAMGLVLGGYGSIAPPVSMPGVPDPPKVPMKWQLRDSWFSTARRARRWGKNFGSVTIVFSAVECVIEKYRAKHDIFNGVSAGCISGAVLAASQGPAGMCFGCIGFAAFSAAIESIMGH
mmetsp:Transcript_1605/g.3732  ORF Transcript_1605/g.3732 Transcript_1605/m.3732 type:complete len:204 (-) Transcript_1605:649-1260(-)|eukprot:CAMPEP_0171498124 /NCGR_PEP_ID=MMETSP0958-20121227/7671_1 /TAXON_ID=87120 /ORGANISM="Aurantiochytrium limacinum, Strain ATCCMYA-1381" /LENGTH=203 /DNA_ID=CAMNT_0012032479 /DNA_START=135 /DNA_END=746 /DNA_ORIENTATION=+